MGDRRVLLGSSAILIGLGSALITGAAVAAAETDTTPGDTSPADGKSAAPAAPSQRTDTRTRTPHAAATTAARGGNRAARVPVVRAAEAADAPAGPPASLLPGALTPSRAPSAARTERGRQPARGLALAVPAPAVSGGQRRSAAPVPDSVLHTAAATIADPLLPGATNGVTGVAVGSSRLEIPGAFIGGTVAADWYFPTQADGSVDAQGVIWLQHGFAAVNTFYSALATDLAQRTNSIVVAPTLSSIPWTFSGGCLSCSTSQQAVADVFLDPARAALVTSARNAGYTGEESELLGAFVLAGHSAGGGFATATAADYVAEGADLLGVVMFDGVSNGTFDGSFGDQIAALDTADIPVYQIAAPAQPFNLFGATTNALLAARPDQYNGAVLIGGSHVDSLLGTNPLIDFVAQLVTTFSPAGSTAAVYALSNGWINDLYVGAGPEAPQYGLYSAANGQIITGPTAAVSLPTPFANNLSPLDALLKDAIDAVGSLFGRTPPPVVNTGGNGVTGYVKPPLSNGVTGVRTGSSTLLIPSGDNGVSALASWYFPTQADGSVQANGIIWLQHGSSRGLQVPLNLAYTALALALAQETNSIVVAPADFGTPFDREAAAEMFVGDRAALNVSANQAGYEGMLPQTFILTGHSAGGGFATAVGAGTVANGTSDDLLGVVMFDGFSRPPTFNEQLQTLIGAGIPVYQIAAPPQSPGNAWGLATEAMLTDYPDAFYGVQIDAGSHNDSLGGTDFLAFLANAIIPILGYRPSPPGGKAAVRALATGWINDLYAGNTPYGPAAPDVPLYGVYGPGYAVPFPYNPAGYNLPFVMGEAGVTTLPAPPPVDVLRYADGQPWFEQASVKLPFAWGLVNTKAIYTPKPDGTIRVQNSGNYFGPDGPESSIDGTAVPVNTFNTRLNVGFGGTPGDEEPGNYWILDYDPEYRWVIVSDPSGFSGYILTRDQTYRTDDPTRYDALVARARALGVWGPITPTEQYPTPPPTAGLKQPHQPTPDV